MRGKGNRGGMWLLRLGMLLCIGAMIWAGWVLLTHRRGTPGEPVDFYRELYRKGMSINNCPDRDTGKYARIIFLADLPQTILTPEEQEELLALLREDWPGVEVKGFLPERYSLHGTINMDMGETILLGGEEILMDGSVMVYIIRLNFPEPLPSREEFGVYPIPVTVMMEVGGYRGVGTSFTHYSGEGWVEGENAQIYAHS